MFFGTYKIYRDIQDIEEGRGLPAAPIGSARKSARPTPAHKMRRPFKLVRSAKPEQIKYGIAGYIASAGLDLSEIRDLRLLQRKQ
jgi:hypothetical protein